MAGDDHIRECRQTHQNIVGDDGVREVFEKHPGFLLVNVDPERPEFGLVPTARPEEIPVAVYGRIADALGEASRPDR